MPTPEDLHEWVSFEDPEEDRTWTFDVTFLMSSWSCIFGQGCKGVLTEDTTDWVQGCCSYGAHFTGPEDIAHTQAMAERVGPTHWQFHDIGQRDGVIQTNDDGETTTRLVDDACIFLNRPGFEGGLGCAFHHEAESQGQRHLDWMPEVCWQVPLRRIDEVETGGHVVSTVREWKRRDWGEGGADFHWWCTDADDAFTSDVPVYLGMRDELLAMVGEASYALLANHLEQRRHRHGTAVFLRHPAVAADPE